MFVLYFILFDVIWPFSLFSEPETTIILKGKNSALYFIFDNIPQVNALSSTYFINNHINTVVLKYMLLDSRLRLNFTSSFSISKTFNHVLKPTTSVNHQKNTVKIIFSCQKYTNSNVSLLLDMNFELVSYGRPFSSHQAQFSFIKWCYSDFNSSSEINNTEISSTWKTLFVMSYSIPNALLLIIILIIMYRRGNISSAFLFKTDSPNNSFCSNDFIKIHEVIQNGYFCQIGIGTLNVDPSNRRFYKKMTKNCSFVMETLLVSSKLNLLSHKHVSFPFLITSANIDDIFLLYSSGNNLVSLRYHLFSKKSLFNYEFVFKTAYECSSGLDYMHQNGIIHGDFSSKNVILDRVHWNIKIIDSIGFRDLYPMDYEMWNDQLLPIRWMCKEQLTNHKIHYSLKTDVWSFGVFLWEICSHGKFPYQEFSNVHDIVDAIINDHYLQKPNNCPDIIHQLMLDTWIAEQNRPSFDCIKYLLKEMSDNVF